MWRGGACWLQVKHAKSTLGLTVFKALESFKRLERFRGLERFKGLEGFRAGKRQTWMPRRSH